MVQDLISASHPYGALIVPTLAKAIDVPTANPRLYYVPIQNDLGKYDLTFADKVCMLELKDPAPNNVKTISTQELLKELQKSPNNQLTQISVLKARLLDMLIADWDRHEDQYKWYAKMKTEKSLLHIT